MKKIHLPLFLIAMLALSSLACQYAYRLFATESATATFEPLATATVLWLPSETPAGPAKTSAPGEAPPTPSATPELAVTMVSPHATPSISPTPLSFKLQHRIFIQIWETVKDYYLYEDYNGVDWNATRTEYGEKIENGLSNAEFYLAMDEMIWSLGDEHSRYNSPEMVAEDDAELSGEHNYVGIGVYISPALDRGGAVVLATFPNSPAERAGVKARDVILTVDGESVLDDEGFLKPIVRGPEGSQAVFSVQSPGEAPREITIERQRITGSMSLPYTILTTPDGKRIGYIFMLGFMDTTLVDQTAEALRQMNAGGRLDGLIIDNRENGGGSSNVLEPIMGYFAEGVVGNFVSRQEIRALRLDDTQDIAGSQKVPLVILVGRGTASFGEIFSGALRDIGRAHIIGTVTDGNVETLWGFDFEDGSLLWLAVETFRPINHPEENWEKSGIIPDEIVEGNWDEASMDTDAPVQAALQYFDGR